MLNTIRKQVKGKSGCAIPLFESPKSLQFLPDAALLPIKQPALDALEEMRRWKSNLSREGSLPPELFTSPAVPLKLPREKAGEPWQHSSAPGMLISHSFMGHVYESSETQHRAATRKSPSLTELQ